MKYKNYQKTRILIGIMIAAIVAAATTINNFYLAMFGVLIGILFLYLAKSKFKGVLVDERVISVSGKASRSTYTIVTVFLALLGLFLMTSARQKEDIYVESLGIIFSYVALLNITIYSLSYHYFNKKHG